MKRFDIALAQSPDQVVVGDARFIGLQMKAPREYLADGYYPRAENKRIIRGVATRPGTRTPLFANLYSAPAGFCGSGTYSNPNGAELGLLAVAGKQVVYGIRDGTVPESIFVETAFASDVEFAQHFDKVLAHQSDPAQPLQYWDGLIPEDGFVAVKAPDPSLVAVGFLGIPNCPYSIHFQDRAWFPVPEEPDTIAASDINNPFLYDENFAKFRVNSGTSDAITGIYPFLTSNLIIGKTRSIDMLANIPGDLGQAFASGGFAAPPPPRMVVISSDIGVVARKSGILVGGRFMFLSDAGPGGIYQMATDEHGNYVVDPTPVSDAIEPLINRINWSYASKAIGSVDGRYAYWAVPMDNATYNNAVLVLNLSTGQWESLDLWATVTISDRQGRTRTFDNPMNIGNIMRLGFYGGSKLFAVNHDDGKVHLLYGGGTDDQLDTADGNDQREHFTVPIQDVLETRGYEQMSPYQPADPRTARDAESVAIALATLEPQLNFDLIIDGSDGDEYPLNSEPITRSRTNYESQLPPYLLDNSRGDADAAYREDYGVEVGDSALLGDKGIRMQRAIPWTKQVALQAKGRFISFRITNSSGYCEVRKIVFGSSATRTQWDAG